VTLAAAIGAAAIGAAAVAVATPVATPVVAIGAAAVAVAMPAAATGAVVVAVAVTLAVAVAAVAIGEPMTCPFCEKLSRLDELAPDELVWRFPHSVALLGPWQYSSGYCVLVARRHATELHQLADDQRRAYLDEMTLLAHAIETCFRPRKMNCELLGNQVPHLHWHLFPRRADDPDTLKPAWLALERAEHDATERARLQTGPYPRLEIARRLREQLQKM
jgi:diadenosine tetraphosphate (Ap4A) HIT family hydrolase